MREQPAFPPGSPDARWSEGELRAFIAHGDTEIAALAPAEALQPLPALDELATSDLEALAAVTSREEIEAIEQHIRERVAHRQQPRRRLIVRAKL